MSLTNCPECNKQVSKGVKTCPHCGYKKPWYQGGCAITIMIFIILFIIVPQIFKEDSSTKSGTKNIQVAQPKIEAQKEISDINFYTLRSKIETMTEAQFKAYTRTLKDKRIHWQGWVLDVNEKVFGGFELWVDMDKPGTFLSVQDVTFDIPEDVALNINKGKPIEFEGDIKTVLDIISSCQINLVNVDLL